MIVHLLRGSRCIDDSGGTLDNHEPKIILTCRRLMGRQVLRLWTVWRKGQWE